MAYFKYQSKNIFYKEVGQGKPLILLHGDTASSTMFEMLLPLYLSLIHILTIEIDGQVWMIVDFQHVKPGKGAAFVRTKIKNVMTGKMCIRDRHRIDERIRK